MSKNPSRSWMAFLLVLLIAGLVAPRVAAQRACFSSEEHARAEQTARVYRAPDPGYDPVLGYNPANGPRRGAPSIDEKGRAKPINCFANKDESPGAGTTPKFHCSIASNTDEDGNLIRYKVKPHFKGQSLDKRNGGDNRISEDGRKLLADNLQRLLDAEQQDKTITRVFEASRNAERDRPPDEWAAEFVRKARMIIDARCTN